MGLNINHRNAFLDICTQHVHCCKHKCLKTIKLNLEIVSITRLMEESMFLRQRNVSSLEKGYHSISVTHVVSGGPGRGALTSASFLVSCSLAQWFFPIRLIDFPVGGSKSADSKPTESESLGWSSRNLHFLKELQVIIMHGNI